MVYSVYIQNQETLCPLSGDPSRNYYRVPSPYLLWNLKKRPIHGIPPAAHSTSIQITNIRLWCLIKTQNKTGSCAYRERNTSDIYYYLNSSVQPIADIQMKYCKAARRMHELENINLFITL